MRILIVDDHAVLRDGLARLLEATPELEVVGAAADGAEGVALTLELAPDLVLMDLSMPVLDGIAATARIAEQSPDTTVLVLTSFGEHERVLAAVDAGAAGYVLKDAEPAELVAAIRSAAAGHAPFDPRVARALLDRAPRRAEPALSPREREVLDLLATGATNKVIALRLGISQGTVKAHLTRVYEQIGATDRTQAAIWAREHLTR